MSYSVVRRASNSHLTCMNLKIFSECPPFTYSMDCSIPCDCVQNNSVSCSKFTGECFCEKGWTSSDCSEDINECLDNRCPDYSQCINLNGSYECQCYAGLEMSVYGTCQGMCSTKHGESPFSIVVFKHP